MPIEMNTASTSWIIAEARAAKIIIQCAFIKISHAYRLIGLIEVTKNAISVPSMKYPLPIPFAIIQWFIDTAKVIQAKN